MFNCENFGEGAKGRDDHSVDDKHWQSELIIEGLSGVALMVGLVFSVCWFLQVA